VRDAGRAGRTIASQTALGLWTQGTAVTVFGLSSDALLGVGVLLVSQGLLMWRANALHARRFEEIAAKLKHQDDCNDSLRLKVAEGDRQIWESIDRMGRELATLIGRWEGVVTEREAQDRRRALEG